ncbi:MAG: phosphohydrolase [Magnetococcales bacterium]|nr:phosphohydrolase [Magnetococcales bacterium]
MTHKVDYSWIQTFSGRAFWPLQPRMEDIDIQDIAHSLAMLCRFNGHGRIFYSVAEHAILVSRLVSPPHAPWGLLHDASEAYLTDLPKPVKRQLPDYTHCEERLQALIAKRFHLDWPLPTAVKHADMVALSTEKVALMAAEPLTWGELPSPADPTLIRGYPPLEAKQLFLARFAELFPHEARLSDSPREHSNALPP